MQKVKLVIGVVISALLIINVFFILQYFFIKTELRQTKQQLVVQQINQKIIIFANLFIEKVLLGSGTVGFEDRLKLENSVRDINNQEIFDKWQAFINSKNDQDAQKAVANLFKILFSKAIE